ncbi:MAG TPA: hypothetical protein VGK32_19390 [Vicinamibacterales bacterium]|jgi:hypothetical protein
MLHIDVPTLFLLSAAIDVMVSASLAYVYFTETTYPGFRDWMVGTACGTVGFALVAARGHVPLLMSTFLASVTIVAGVDRLLRGIQRFTGLDGRPSKDELALYAVSVAAFAYYSLIESRTDMRIVILSACIAYVSAKAARDAAVRLRGPYSMDGRFLGLLFLVIAMANAARGGVALWVRDATTADLARRGTLETVPLVVSAGLVICFTGVFLGLNGKRLRLELEEAHAQVQQLEGIIPICMYCKKIRDDQNSWLRLERYLAEHSQAEFSHGICPECAERVQQHLG